MSKCQMSKCQKSEVKNIYKVINWSKNIPLLLWCKSTQKSLLCIEYVERRMKQLLWTFSVKFSASAVNTLEAEIF